MKRMSIILIVLVAAASVVAGEHGAAEHERHAGLVESLNLTADQATAWENAEKSFHESIHPLQEQQTALRSQLEQLLASNADACSIGAQEQQIWSVGKQIKSAFIAFEQKRDAILTPEQKAKLDALHQTGEMHKMRERHMLEH